MIYNIEVFEVSDVTEFKQALESFRDAFDEGRRDRHPAVSPRRPTQQGAGGDVVARRRVVSRVWTRS